MSALCNPAMNTIDCLLHDHIDGSIAMLEILPELYKLSGLELPEQLRNFENHEDLHKKVVEWFNDPRIDITTRFGLVTNVLQNKDTLHLAGYQYVRVRHGQGMRYCEGTFASHYSTRGDQKSMSKLTNEEAIDALVEGIRAGENEYSGIECNIIATFGRELIETIGENGILEIFKELSECDPAYVVAQGLVCDEAKYPPRLWVNVLNRARKLGYAVDPWCPHAGEWANLPGEDPNSPAVKARLLENQRVAIYEMGASRGEHFRLLHEDSELCRYMADNGIGITSCPDSYAWMIKDASELRLELVQARGIRISLNPDDDLFMNGIPKVWRSVQDSCKLAEEDQLRFRRDAWKLRNGNRKPVPEDIGELVY